MAFAYLFSPRFHFKLSIAVYLLAASSQLFLAHSEMSIPLRGVSVGTPSIEFSTSPHDGVTCERIRVAGSSLLNLKGYANPLLITVTVRGALGRKYHGTVDICLHRNARIGLCECEEWQSLELGEWSGESSPFVKRFIDVRFEGRELGIVKVSIEKELQDICLVCLVAVLILHLCAPLLSSWVPFYYTTSMLLGILLFAIFSLYQGMKMLNRGRKSILYLAFVGSLVKVASFVARYFTTLVQSILVNFGIVADMDVPVTVASGGIVVLGGAGLGYWIVRKYVISEDGRAVKTGVAQIVRWAMRGIAMLCVSQSNLEPLLGWIVWCTCWFIGSLITSTNWRTPAMLHREDVEYETYTSSNKKIEVDTSSNVHTRAKSWEPSCMNSSAVKPCCDGSPRRRWSDGMIR